MPFWKPTAKSWIGLALSEAEGESGPFFLEEAVEVHPVLDATRNGRLHSIQMPLDAPEFSTSRTHECRVHFGNLLCVRACFSHLTFGQFHNAHFSLSPLVVFIPFILSTSLSQKQYQKRIKLIIHYLSKSQKNLRN